MRLSVLPVMLVFVTSSCGSSDPAELERQRQADEAAAANSKFAAAARSRHDLIESLSQEVISVISTSRLGEFRVRLGEWDWYWRPFADTASANAGRGSWLGIQKGNSYEGVFAYGEHAEQVVQRYFNAQGLEKSRKPPAPW